MADYIIVPSSPSSFVAPSSVTSGITYDGSALSELAVTNNEGLNSGLGKISTLIGGHTTNIATINTSITSINTSITTINTTIASVSTENVIYSKSVGTLTCLSAASTKLTDILDAINTQVCTIQTNITSLQSTVGSTSDYPQDGRSSGDLTVTNELSKDHINKTKTNTNKGDVVTTSGLNVTIGAIDNALVKGTITQRSQVVVAMSATKDNYVFVDRTESAGYTVKNVTIGATAPTATSDELSIYKFTTDGSSVTATTDIRNEYPYDGDYLEDESIISRHITDLTVTTNKININDDLSIRNFKITNLATPVSANDATNKSYVDGKVVNASGTTGVLSKFTGTNTLGDSIITESGTTLSIAGDKIGMGISAFESPVGIVKYLKIEDTSSAGIILNDTGGTEWSIYSADSSLYFNASTGGVSLGNRMTLLEDGRLGIGKTPGANTLLDVKMGTGKYAVLNSTTYFSASITGGADRLNQVGASDGHASPKVISIGVRGTSDGTGSTERGAVSDGYIYSNTNSNGLNIISQEGAGSEDDYIRFYAGGDATDTASMFITGRAVGAVKKGDIGIGIEAPLAKLHIAQTSSSGARPCLELQQDDVDDVFIEFDGTSAADSTKSISSSTATASAKFGAVRISINGTDKWIRVYDSAV